MYLGIDFGTSGCRAVVIDGKARVTAETSISLPAPEKHRHRIQQHPAIWLKGLEQLLDQLASHTDLRIIRRLAIDGTSGTVLICDNDGKPLTPALMYNDAGSTDALDILREACPDSQHLCLTASSGLARAVQLHTEVNRSDIHVLNQADYLSNLLTGHWGFSDYHNALKLGFDPRNSAWPDWVRSLLPEGSLPTVSEPGQFVHNISASMAQRFGLSPDLQVCAGSTDANAAFIATGSVHLGDAVTSLGSTLVLKLLNDHPIQDLSSGIYSHRLGEFWLVGGASNAGAAILREYFSDHELVEYSATIDPDHPTGLNFYPLSFPGERFPDNDPDKQPLLSPRPDSDVVFLQAILEGLSDIENNGYRKLADLGATHPHRVQTTGGGAVNPQWSAMRERILGIPVTRAVHTQACYGSALLALHGLKDYRDSTR